MIILSSGSTFVEDQKQTASIGEYRMSTFVIKEYIGDDFLLYNTVNGYLLYFYDEVDFMQSISSLIKMWFYVKVDFDEFVWINDMRYNKTICEKDCNISRYTIFTTLNCNARCFYCYEKQQPHLTMSKKTAIDVADYIISNANGANQLIRWFGGEPLFNYDAIDIICQKLKDNNIRFRSRMITNGVLFDKELINRALNLWNLRKVQITLDGTKDVYQRYKRFVDSKGNEFETVLNNIEQLAESGVPVNIRLNQDVNNTENLFEIETNNSPNLFRSISFISDFIKDNKGGLIVVNAEGAAPVINMRYTDFISINSDNTYNNYLTYINAYMKELINQLKNQDAFIIFAGLEGEEYNNDISTPNNTSAMMIWVSDSLEAKYQTRSRILSHNTDKILDDTIYNSVLGCMELNGNGIKSGSNLCRK